MAWARVREERQPCGRKVSRWVGAGMFTQGGMWLGVAPPSAARGLCWAPDVSRLQPAGPPHPQAQRGFIKSGCEEAQGGRWLQPAGSAPWA